MCPVNIFALKGETLQIVEGNLDECTLCELCLDAAPPGTVRVKKLYGRARPGPHVGHGMPVRNARRVQRRDST